MCRHTDHRFSSFWATVCKTVCPMLSDHCLSVLSCLSVTLVYCGQTIGWIIKMKLGMEVDIGPGHIVLDGDPAPLPKTDTAPNFRPMSVVAKRLDELRCHMVRRYRPRSRRHCVRWKPRSRQKGVGHSTPSFGPCIVAKWLHGPRCHFVRGYASAKATLCYMKTP